MSMIVGMDLQAALKKSKTRCLASSRETEFGGTFTLRSVNDIFPSSTRSLQSHQTAMYRRPSTETGGGYHVLNTSQTTPHQLPFTDFLTSFIGSQLNYTLLFRPTNLPLSFPYSSPSVLLHRPSYYLHSSALSSLWRPLKPYRQAAMLAIQDGGVVDLTRIGADAPPIDVLAFLWLVRSHVPIIPITSSLAINLLLRFLSL